MSIEPAPAARLARLYAARMQRPRQAGQALAEALVVALALVPLAVLVVLLGKYQSMQAATVAASRSLAFDCAARPQLCGDAAAAGWLTESVRTRHFVRPDRAVLSADQTSSGSAASQANVDRHPLWQDRGGRPLLESLDHVGAAVTQQRFDAGLGTAIGRAANADTSGIGQVDDIERGLLDARVELSVAASFAGRPAFVDLDPMHVVMRARTAILSDNWQASGPSAGPASVAARVNAGARLDSIRETRLDVGYQLSRWALDLAGGLGLEPAAGSFRYHAFDPQVIPADRVGAP
jgi:hypothetical protein